MNYERLWTIADGARAGHRLSPDDTVFLAEAVPRALSAFPEVDLPPRVRHPAGFALSGAPIGTFLRAGLLLAGRNAFGPRYDGAPLYQAVEKDLAFGIMRSHFHHGYPKGAHCCLRCSLAVYPVLASGAIRYFDCAPLAAGLRSLIEERKWRFVKPPSEPMLRWSLGAA
ncbi:MAG: hypothetical protein AB7O56_08810 [Bauldia sp.]